MAALHMFLSVLSLTVAAEPGPDDVVIPAEAFVEYFLLLGTRGHEAAANAAAGLQEKYAG